jgi:hypothetical protein
LLVEAVRLGAEDGAVLEELTEAVRLGVEAGQFYFLFLFCNT